MESFAHDLYGRGQTICRACRRRRYIYVRAGAMRRVEVMTSRNLKLCLCFGITAGFLQAQTGNLNIYFIDVEGGAATLTVTPSGQSLLVDTGNPSPTDRDAKRIF